MTARSSLRVRSIPAMVVIWLGIWLILLNGVSSDPDVSSMAPQPSDPIPPQPSGPTPPQPSDPMPPQTNDPMPPQTNDPMPPQPSDPMPPQTDDPMPPQPAPFPPQPAPMPPQPTCPSDFVVDATGGSLKYPSMENFKPGVGCSWIIGTDEDNTSIELTADNNDIEDAKDYLDVYTMDGSLLYRITGQQGSGPQTATFPYNKLVLYFSTTVDNQENSGFQLKYTIVPGKIDEQPDCVSIFRRSSGGSLYYPNTETYKKDYSCSWIIGSDDDTQFVQLRMLSGRLKPSKDFLTVYSMMGVPLYRFSGNAVKPPIVSFPFHQVLLLYTSDNKKELGEFQLDYILVSGNQSIQPVCSSNFSADTNGGSLEYQTDGSNNSNSNTDAGCSWIIGTKDDSMSVQVTFIDRDIYDNFLDVYTLDGALLHRLSGDGGHESTTVTFPFNMLVLYFSSETQPNMFKLEFTFVSGVVNSQPECTSDFSITETGGRLFFPSIRTQGDSCFWIIRGQSSMPITISLLNMNITDGYDSLTVYSIDGVPLYRFTGKYDEDSSGTDNGHNGTNSGGDSGGDNGGNNETGSGKDNGGNNGTDNADHNGGHNGTDNGDDNGRHNGTDNGDENGGHKEDENGGHNGTDNGNHNGGHNETDNGNHNGTENGDDNGGHNGTDSGNHNGGHNETDGEDHGGDHGGNDGGPNDEDPGGDHGGHNETDNGGDNGGHNETGNGGDNGGQYPPLATITFPFSQLILVYTSDRHNEHNGFELSFMFGIEYSPSVNSTDGSGGESDNGNNGPNNGNSTTVAPEISTTVHQATSAVTASGHFKLKCHIKTKIRKEWKDHNSEEYRRFNNITKDYGRRLMKAGLGSDFEDISDSDYIEINITTAALEKAIEEGTELSAPITTSRPLQESEINSKISDTLAKNGAEFAAIGDFSVDLNSLKVTADKAASTETTAASKAVASSSANVGAIVGGVVGGVVLLGIGVAVALIIRNSNFRQTNNFNPSFGVQPATYGQPAPRGFAFL